MSSAAAVEALFFEALEHGTAAERAAYLDAACGGDGELRRQVEKLLRAHPRVGDFLQKPAVEQLSAAPGPAGATQGPDASTDDGRAVPAGREGPPPARTEGAGAGDEEDTALDFLQPSTRPDSLGRLGHYEALDVLGRGGFGIVLRAFDEQLQRVVAIKVLAPQLAATSAARKRFVREAQSSAKLRQENVVRVYAVEEKPLPYLVMEFIPGETLQQRLDRTGPLGTGEVLRIGRQIAEGLAAAHGAGLIHRDIKPSNILIEADPGRHVTITDFGLARAAGDARLTQSGLLAGTPLFMAPEQASGETLDQRADLFSLGSVLYTMCTGRPPFLGKSTFEILRRVAEDMPRPIPETNPEVPPWLCEIITRLHAKKPADRIGTAREVADLLGRGPAALPPSGSVPPAPDTTPALRRKRFRTGRRAAAAAVLLVLLAGLGITEATGITHFHGAIIRLFSPEGTLVVEVDDPRVSVKIDGPELVIRGAGAKEIRLKPGRYTVEASKDGKLVRRELVTITNNGRRVVRVRQEAAPPDPKAARAAAWERAVATLSAAQQVKFVAARLRELNPGFDGKVEPTVENGVVTGLAFSTEQVSDISPLRVLAHLRNLDCGGARSGKLSDLSPLAGLPLTHLNVSQTGVSDLAPLKGMKLIRLTCTGTKVADLAPLQGMPLQELFCDGTRVTSLSALKGMKLTVAHFEGTEVADLAPLRGMPLCRLSVGRRVTDLTPLKEMPLQMLTCAGATRLYDLSPLKGMPLTYLHLGGTRVSDLSPLKGMPLTYLHLGGTRVTDLTPLRDMKTLKFLCCCHLVTDLSPLQGLALGGIQFETFKAERDAKILRAIPTLKTINNRPAAQLWKEIDEQVKAR